MKLLMIDYILKPKSNFREHFGIAIDEEQIRFVADRSLTQALNKTD